MRILSLKTFRQFVCATVIAVLLLLPADAFAASLSESAAVDYIENTLGVPVPSDLSQHATQAEAVEWMARSFNVSLTDNDEGVSDYKDINPSASYAPYINKFYRIGALPRVNAYRENFHPDRKVKLYTVLKMLLYAQGIPTPRVIEGEMPARDINKESVIAPVFKKSFDLGIITPGSNQFIRPYGFVSYQQLAEILYLFSQGAPATNNTTNENVIRITGGTGDKTDELLFLDHITDTVLKKYFYADDLTAADRRRMVYSALENFVNELEDPNSVFLRPANSDSFQDTLSGEFEGIGAYIGQNQNGDIAITAPLKGSPAEKAGLLANDVIIRVDEESTSGKTLPEVISLIKGPRGSTVVLTIRRTDKKTGQESTLTFDVVRESIKILSVEKELIEKDGRKISHISVSQFGAKTSSEFRDVVDDVIKNDRPDGIILDLRGNPGGYLESAVSMLSYFLPKDTTVVLVKYKGQTETRDIGYNNELLADYPVVVLINGGSASASEIVAAALRELKDTKLVGETSYGKGTVQELLVYEDGSSLKLTVAEYTPPSGNSIDRVGLFPDVTVEDNLNTETDETLEKGITELFKAL